MANFDKYLKGTAGTKMSVGNSGENIYSGVIDLARLNGDGYASTDVIRLVPFKAGTNFAKFDAEITKALVGITAVDAGNTISSSTDPDDYIDNQSDTAVGRFTAYTAGSQASAILTADGYIAVRLTGTIDASTDGKIAWQVILTPASKDAAPRMEHRTYPNV